MDTRAKASEADAKEVKPIVRNLDTKKALVDVAGAWKGTLSAAMPSPVRPGGLFAEPTASPAIQLDKRRNEWDTQASEIVANQDASVASRKALATTTKGTRVRFPCFSIVLLLHYRLLVIHGCFQTSAMAS